MSWTKSGSVNLTNGSAVVYGNGTTWASGGKARPGDVFVGPAGALYEVLSVQSNTQLTLASPYLGATANAQSYALIHTGLLPAELAAGLSDLQSKYLTTIAQLYEWETSTADTVQITNPATGVTADVKPLKKIPDEIDAAMVEINALIETNPGLSPLFRTNPSVFKQNVSIPAGYNAMSTGPLEVAEGVVVDVENTAAWAIC